MSTLEEFRHGLDKAWGALAEGWQHLRERSGQALTRFTPVTGGELETAGERIALQGSRWTLLAAEVQDTGNEIIVRLEVPGMDRENFEVSVPDGRTLVVRGEKRVERKDTRGNYYIMERAYGHFERAIPLPTPVEESGARASYRRGVLRIELPKTQSARTRRIDVQSD